MPISPPRVSPGSPHLSDQYTESIRSSQTLGGPPTRGGGGGGRLQYENPQMCVLGV